MRLPLLCFILSRKEVEQIKTKKLTTGIKKEGALMRRTGKNKLVAMMIVIAMVIGMLPMGVLPAFAATTSVQPSSPVSKVITGAGSTEVKNQPTDNITLREDVDKVDWGTADRTVRATLDAGAKFSAKPTVTVNGTALASSQVTLPTARDYVEFKINGDDGVRDQIVISNIKVDLGVVAIGNLAATITGLPNVGATAKIAKVQNGLIFAEPGTITTVDVDKTNQALAAFTLTESTRTIAKQNDFITITAPAGITFYEPPVATVTQSALTLYSNTATLNDARTEAKWQVNDESVPNTAAIISIASKINVAASFAADTEIKFTGATSSSDYTVAPASVKVAKSSAADALKFEAAAAPTISNSANQVAANITISETKAEALAAGDDTLTIELVSGTFASSPVATPSGAGLSLKNAAGDAVTTGVAGKLTGAGSTKATWSVADQSSAAGAITITGLAINANGLSDGAVKVKIYGGVVGIPLAANAKQLTIANVSTTQTITLSATSSPALSINAANQAGGDIIITETKAGAITGPLVLSIFGNTSDNEVLFGDKPTVSVTTGDLEVTSTVMPVGTDYSKMQINLTASSTKSTIKVSGIKYDINSKAKAGAIQVIVTDNGSRVGAVTNAFIGDKPAVFPDVPGSHWAVSYIENLVTRGILAGYTDGTFKPNNTITRAEFAKIVAVAKGLGTATGSSFSDTAGHWAAGYIEAVKAAGIIDGYENGTFRPNNNITRAEIAKIVVAAAGFAIDTSGAGFSDIAGHWASDYILTAANKGIVGGYTDGTFRPNNSATRAEASKMVSIWVNM